MTLKMRGFDKLEKKKILRQSILTQNGDSRARSNLRHCYCVLNIRQRAQLCVQEKGGHFEHLM